MFIINSERALGKGETRRTGDAGNTIHSTTKLPHETRYANTYTGSHRSMQSPT